MYADGTARPARCFVIRGRIVHRPVLLRTCHQSEFAASDARHDREPPRRSGEHRKTWTMRRSRYADTNNLIRPTHVVATHVTYQAALAGTRQTARTTTPAALDPARRGARPGVTRRPPPL
eukprot:3817488-Prymnesium_polylepis.1